MAENLVAVINYISVVIVEFCVDKISMSDSLIFNICKIIS